jgi:hypothetical protein
MKNGMKKFVLDKLDSEDMLNFMVKLVTKMVNSNEKSDSLNIISECMSIIFCLLLHDKNLCDNFFNPKENPLNINLEQFLIQGLFAKDSKEIRVMFRNFFYVFCKASAQIEGRNCNQQLIEILLRNIPSEEKFVKDCK